MLTCMGVKTFFMNIILNNKIRYFILVFLIFSALPFTITAQNTDGEGDNKGKKGEEVPVMLSPVFPETEDGLVFVEGESAVSTNFAVSPVYNYGASSYKTLQLIQRNAPYGGQAYFAEYAFYVEEEGDYAFWYGGTPPGPQDTVYPSFASPFRYILDGADAVPVYRENLAVVEAYTPAYYWMEVNTVHLDKGVHRLRIEVPEKRRYDGQYYFFIDAFFFLRQDRMEDELTLAPPVFPRDRTTRSIDNPFQSIAYYEKAIKDNPGNGSSYIVLSMIYSLIGDYINAIKNLNKAVSLDPTDPYPLLLTAKNRFWNGEFQEGLTAYRQLLTMAPDNPAYWAEAGKVAAWTGNYRESIEFFTKGLEIFPDDLNLKVNLGLTYLWMARNDDADTQFAEAEESAADSHERGMELGDIHKVNGYPEYSVNIYNSMLEEFPEYLDTYLSLEDSYRQMGETEKAEAVIQRVYDSFEESSALSSYMNVYEEKKNMKDGILQDYIDALEEQPDNVALRQLLSQTYFWNGMQDEAVDHHLRILINKLYISIKEFDDKATDLLSLMDRMGRYRYQYQTLRDVTAEGAKELASLKSAYDKARASKDKKPDDRSLAEKAELAGEQWAEAYDEYRLWMDRLYSLEADGEDLDSDWDDLKAAEDEEEEVFRQLLGDSEWSWDRLFTTEELKKVRRNEPFLAGYVLARLALFEGRSEKAADYLDREIFEDDPAATYGHYEALLWGLDEDERSDMWDDESDTLTLYRQHLFDMEAASWKEGDESYLIAPASEEGDALIQEMEERSRQLKEEEEGVEKRFSKMQKTLDRKLVRQIYYFEQDTYLLRYELGDYYLEMEENLKAVRQYERVLAMEPHNISANYKLGIVSQRYGDWYRAMEQYKKVYYQNPRYENASYYYNQLARQNADVVSVTGQNLTDSLKTTYELNADYDSKINSTLGWGLSYDLQIDRRYRTWNISPEEDEYDGDKGTQFKLHTLSGRVSYTISKWDLVLTPVAGVYLTNSVFGEDMNDVDGVVKPSDITGELTIEPLLGLEADWNWNFLDLVGSYFYKVEEESVYPDHSIINSHFMSLNANTYFPLEQYYDWGPVTTRTYGEFEILEDDQKWQFFQEGAIEYVVARAPLVRLRANGIFNYEDGSEDSANVVDYYMPNGVMEVKGGLRASVNFHNETYSEALEFSLFAGAGSYWTDVIDGDDPTDSIKVEGLFSVFYVKETMTLFLNIGGNQTYLDGKDLNFWEFSATLGGKFAIPSLLTN